MLKTFSFGCSDYLTGLELVFIYRKYLVKKKNQIFEDFNFFQALLNLFNIFLFVCIVG